MANQLIGIRFSDDLLKDMELVVKLKGHASVQEYIRETMRDHTKEYCRQEALIQLDKLAGSFKGKKVHILTREERDEIARSMFLPKRKEPALRPEYLRKLRKIAKEKPIKVGTVENMRKLHERQLRARNKPKSK